VVACARGVGKNLQALTLQGFSRWLRFVKPVQRPPGFRSGLFCQKRSAWFALFQSGARPASRMKIRGLREISARSPRPKNFAKKYNRSAMKNTRQLQCKALRLRRKIRRRKNNEKQWK